MTGAAGAGEPIGTSDPPEPGPAALATLWFTFFSVGVTVSVALAERDVGGVTTMVTALVAYSATSELAYLAVRDAGGSVAAAVASGWLVATRFGILTVSLSNRLVGGRLSRLIGAWFSVDPNVGLMILQRDPARARRVYWRTTAVLAAGWLGGNAVGLAVGDVLGDTSRWGIDVVFPAALLAIIGPLLRTVPGLAAGLGGAAICVALLPLAPAGAPILASSLAAVAVVAVRSRRRSTTDDGGDHTADADADADADGDADGDR